ncbi:MULTISPECIES: HAMP domain-containing sensor histidine kinase [unclassified Enterococcus]|uniref:HAMP domain-containing sensor histidine kinase n=1 Tax=unclassified Enterococcus TaxID=2608891 RepID=UPI001556E4F1|nr:MULTISPECIES: HAMP domain-containing sensor histidine kinase [unclassified Enterococcus]MBS7577598.1 HAMP domain-containing histidine kinase [Enterococcus sp. MMGLQ5-2]MBS7584903.1 HAMP domain-containing histidine kinase [Enterococcus sp. MMGLQ5-1]NPD12758.1 HAMP domain-containing histidine kinase [Enterococcus sp. MMGLQ5-1]NPD37431.1 HAMP domain-containing histidine kinase [Enterococcus sp. MMGLQ5-2]
MKRKKTDQPIQHGHSLFSLSLFTTFFLVLLLMSGVHIGLIVFMNKYNINSLIQVFIPTIYWAIVALSLTLYTGKRVKSTYEKPMLQLAEATNKVATGDFSVYVSPLHTADKHDYLDMMILDFNKMVEELGSVEVLKTDFFSDVSHEIKTPLAVIQNTTELLRNQKISQTGHEIYLNSITQATKRLSDLITNMLKLNKLEKQTIQSMPDTFDLNAQLCACAIQFEDEWEKKEIEFEADIEETVKIASDEGLLALVWTNLLSNAVKFTDKGGSIRLTQHSNEKEIQVSISDTGCGMDENTRNHVFDKFYQGDTSRSTEGNGLGLALVKRIIEIVGGSIKIDSILNQGTTFHIILPKTNDYYAKEDETDEKKSTAE